MEIQRIKSRYKIFGGFGLLLMFSLLVSLLYIVVVKSMIENNADFSTWLNNENDFGPFVILTLLETLFLTLFATQNKYIIIENKQMIFINPLLPFIRITKQFSEYDYYITTVEQARDGAYEAIWLIKNGRVKDRISSFYYLNYSELKDNLAIYNKGDRWINPFIQALYLLRIMKVR